VALVKTRAKSVSMLAKGRKLGLRQEHNGRLVLSGFAGTASERNLKTIKVQFEDARECMKEKDPAPWLEGNAR